MLKLKKTLFLVILFSFSYSLMATDETSLGQLSDSLRFEKKQVENIVDTMVRNGRLSVDEGSRAKREIASVQEDDFEELKSEMIKRLRSTNYANN